MAHVRSKRYKHALEQLTERTLNVEDAIKALKGFPPAKFDESVEISFQLGIDPKQSSQLVRGTVTLPHGTGKKVRVLVFCRGEEARHAEEAGADYVGAEELINKVADGWIDFDVVVAHPNIMKDISKLGKALGPRGLMPSPKVGTVTQDIGKAVTDLKKGKVELKTNKTGGLNVACGKISFTEDKLIDNVKAVIKTVVEHRPAGIKGIYIKNASLSSTMSPGISLDRRSLASA